MMRKNTEDKGFTGAVVITIVTVVLMFLLTGALLAGLGGGLTDPFTGLLILLCAALYIAIAVGVIAALRERWREIQGGEEDEAKKY